MLVSTGQLARAARGAASTFQREPPPDWEDRVMQSIASSDPRRPETV